LTALHPDENVRQNLRNGKGGGMNWPSIEMKQSRAYVYILYDQNGLLTPGSCIENPFGRGNLPIDELKRLIATCVENVRERGGNDSFKIGLTARLDNRMNDYNGYPGYHVLDRSQFLDCAIFREGNNSSINMNLEDYRLLEQGVICACAADEELSNRVLNVTGSGDYFWNKGDDERELVLYIRFGKKGMKSRQIQDIIHAAGKESRALKAKKNHRLPAVIPGRRHSAQVRHEIIKERIVEQNYQCGCGKTFARNNALCAHIRVMNMAPEEPLECDFDRPKR
jgi:hypothetical protein